MDVRPRWTIVSANWEGFQRTEVSLIHAPFESGFANKLFQSVHLRKGYSNQQIQKTKRKPPDCVELRTS